MTSAINIYIYNLEGVWVVWLEICNLEGVCVVDMARDLSFGGTLARNLQVGGQVRGLGANLDPPI